MKKQLSYNRQMIRLCLYTLLSLNLLLISNNSSGQSYKVFKDTTITTGTFGYQTISILPNTVITPATGQSIRIYALPASCAILNTALSAAQNYRLTSIPRIAGYNAASTGYTTCDVMQTVEYIDGLGQPLQTVQVKGSPNADKDVVQPFVYDNYGREAFKYQPYTVSTTTPGSLRLNSISEQNTFYQQTGQGYVNTNFPFSQTVYEASPLNKILEQGASGNDWQPAGTPNVNGNAGHTLKTTYGANVVNEVVLWKLNSNGNGATGTNSYDSGQLFKTTTTDENGNLSLEYKDKTGHIVCKKIQAGTNVYQSTYYVYDDLDNLSYVIPQMPGVYPTSFTEGDSVFLNYIYGYHYDGRNRLVQKKIPGKDWEYIIYNQLDQPVLVQDGVQRTLHQWMVTKYDAVGRVILTGLFKDTATPLLSQSQLQTNVYAAAQYDNRDYTSNTAGATGYTISSYPSVSTLLTLSYYDNYNYPGGTPYQASLTGTLVKPAGLLTGTKSAVLNPDGTIGPMLWAVKYYDNKSREVQTDKQHYLGGLDKFSTGNYDEIVNTYNFNNQVTQTVRSHYTSANAGSPALAISISYTYDHMGRKTETYETISGGSNAVQKPVLLSKLTYNEIGQLRNRSLHNNLQGIDYTYNERGWLNSSSAPLFTMQLNYNSGLAPQWNGNITSQYWGTPGNLNKHYDYTYDQLSRLTAGLSNEGYNEQVTNYDPLGNILQLIRKNPVTGITSTYVYNYAGSQLTSVTGLTNGSYAYDTNGNMSYDARNGKNISYNVLNLPQSVTSAGFNLAYTYDADGSKLRKNNGTIVTDYIDGIQYDNGIVSFIQTEEGRAINSGGGYIYEYTLADHLGNSRVSFDQNSGQTLRQQNDYYPFGLAISRSITSPPNKYLYNGKELQEELGQYDYGARFYDPLIGRFSTLDPLSETSRRFSPYNYGNNNPIRFIDPDGMAPEDIIYKNRLTGKEVGRELLPGDNVYRYTDAKNTAELVANNFDRPQLSATNPNAQGGQPAASQNVDYQDMSQATTSLAVVKNVSYTFGTEYAAAKVVSGVTSIFGAAGKAVPNGSVYSVAFETELSSTLYPGKGYYSHFKAANTVLSNTMASDATFSSSMSELGISIPRSSTGSILGKSPTNWVWHHDIGAGVMQLTPKVQHSTGSIFWNTMHPGGLGGMATWGR